MGATSPVEGGVPKLVATVSDFDVVPGQDEAGQIKGIGPGNSPAGFPNGTANFAAARNCWYSGTSSINLLNDGLIKPLKQGGRLVLACTSSQLPHLATVLVVAIDSGLIDGASLSMPKLSPATGAGPGPLSFGFCCSTTLLSDDLPVRTAAEALLLDRRPAAESLLPSPSTAGQEQKPTYSSFGTIFASWSCPRRNQLALLAKLK